MINFEKFNKVHEKALENIENILTKSPEEYDYGLKILGEWIMNTGINPYSFLDEGWAGDISTSSGFESLLYMLHHALYDDGDITFVKVNGDPKIIFKCKWDDDFVESLFNSSIKDMIKRFGDKLEDRVEILDIKPEEFPKIAEEAHAAHIKRCFIMDAGMESLEFAIEHYSEYDCFNESWIKEFKGERK